MAQAFQTLGSQVTLIEGERRLLPREEEFACAQVTEALERYGVDIRCGQKAERVEQADDGTVTVTTSDGGSAVGDVLLVALGREPSTKDLGVETVGLEPGKTIKVDGLMRVPGHPWLYAIGDINGKALFTHMGKYQARLVADHLLGHDHVLAHGADGPLSPRVVFTEPQVAAVGHTTETRREGRPDRRHLRDLDLGQRRRLVLRPQRARDDALDRRPRAPDRRRLHDHGRRRRRLPARGDDRDRRRGAARAAPSRHPIVSHAQRSLAAAGGLTHM